MTRAASAAMAINGAFTRYCGPGGGTRHLHQERPVRNDGIFRVAPPTNKGLTFADGGEIGSTCIERCFAFCSGWYRCNGPQLINANDNDVEFAVAA